MSWGCTALLVGIPSSYRTPTSHIESSHRHGELESEFVDDPDPPVRLMSVDIEGIQITKKYVQVIYC